MQYIYTQMLNFQDVLEQRGENKGALWCDEGVYCIAKDIQLSRPEQFGNIFLGLGPFHWSKILMAAAGKWLKESGIYAALSASGVFKGSGIVEESVMKGGDYEKAKDGMNIIAEARTELQFEAFKTTEEYKRLQESMDIDQDVIQVMKNLYQTSDDYGNEFGQAWAQAKVS